MLAFILRPFGVKGGIDFDRVGSRVGVSRACHIVYFEPYFADYSRRPISGKTCSPLFSPPILCSRTSHFPVLIFL